MFGLDSTHFLLAAIGAAIVLASWLPRFVSGREPSTSALLILAGLGATLAFPALPSALSPLDYPILFERGAEFCVIIGLFGTGLRIDRLAGRKQWMPTVRLLLIAMPLCIAAVALSGWWLAGMTLAGGLLLGSVLAPTDPVLAGDVQVGPPQEGGEHPVRFALTTEAGLNDGLAFPFVYLAIAIAIAGGIDTTLLGEWLGRDLLYRVVVGGLAGIGIGWLLGKILFDWPDENSLSKTGSGVVALAGVLLAYGLTELAEGYGFIAAFVASYTLRRSESHHRYHRRLHDFSEALEQAMTAILLLALGAAIPYLLPYFDWRHAAIGIALIFIIRPLIGWLSLTGSTLDTRSRLVVAFYGVRGIGSIYYLAYAAHMVDLTNEGELWATVAFTILLSSVVHGLTAGIAVPRVTGEDEEPDREPETIAPAKSAP
ncbi:cation:proton antiporter [Sphingomonas sp. LY29]|uniref:cation:proton antiporter n=1 Tax=Sphingomonas sp. LY29 TaxID=3095341 RepID=UPI002D764AAA|nr:cation:proton antiporter [Sphingomonas sp. LY29]WRP26166.1 cation:proton antiporter [Sphingomonas sp. LY29]